MSDKELVIWFAVCPLVVLAFLLNSEVYTMGLLAAGCMVGLVRLVLAIDAAQNSRRTE